MIARFDNIETELEIGDIVKIGSDDVYMICRENEESEVYLINMGNGKIYSYGYYDLNSFAKEQGVELVCKNKKLVLTNLKSM